MVEELQETLFNMAVEDLKRLNSILIGLDRVTMLRELDVGQDKIIRYKENYCLLLACFKNLQCMMKEKEEIEFREAMTFLKKMFNKFKYCVSMNKKVTFDLPYYFDGFELQLRKLAKERGLILPDKKEDSGL